MYMHEDMVTHIACVYIALARIFDYVTNRNTYIHKCMHIYVHQCLRYMYVIREIQVCLCVCMCMHVCMHMHIYTHIHTCVYVCMCTALMLACQNKHDSAPCMHACMYVCMYTYTHVDVNISISKSSNVRNK